MLFVKLHNLFKEPPNIGQLAELVGCSHQNTKQMLLKLENGGYVRLLPDENDKRKRRIVVTERTSILREKYNEGSMQFMQALFSDVSGQEIAAAIGTITKLDSRLKEIMGESK